MKSLIVLFSLLGLSAPAVHAAPLIAYRCTCDTDASDVFPVLVSNGVYRVATSMGSTHFFDLERIPASDLGGLPAYKDGVYYRGGNDLWVIFATRTSFRVLKPLSDLPNGLKYSCQRSL